MTMSETAQPQSLPKPMDHALLARLTGGLGDMKSVEKLCQDFGQLYSEFLPDVFHSETNLTIEVGYLGFKSGLMRDLVVDLGDNFVLANTSLRNWSQNFVMACGNGFVITLMETLLGGMQEFIGEPIKRPLSNIELDLAVMVFERIANVLRSGVNATGGFEPIFERPHNWENRLRQDGEQIEEFGALVHMSIKLGKITSDFALIIPQKTLLKTNVTAPKSKNQVSKARKEWAEQLAEQVRKSQVTLEGRISLQSLSLLTVSKLAAGDVIPFLEKGDVTVDVSANGRDLYTCEFGRAGDHYTVRVKSMHSTDSELLRHLMR
ncbi:FliM/FliN family flagellar motor switch protein [Agrobacterium vitis]|uniref:Flagellar motor switch protein FliM n=1 Tax=Agrobacterium vitis TaxID=373 RepID=A0AAE2RF70_AGRVI|nr:FliM/FliN family flagellar motor switch protein [Agrobacterium vitis]MBF2717178.1 flagellar motor switch protein FliM [Agrobacterium vitis]MUZ61336.1 flagellar motor switch protein FliM [Agrobacterium vitis]MVA19433.1 flagellar motor switch protein FliM [Agrobacterium vitis]